MMQAGPFDVEGFRANFVSNMSSYPELQKYDVPFTSEEIRCAFHELKLSATVQGMPLAALKDALDRVIVRITERFNDLYQTGDLDGLITNVVTLIEKEGADLLDPTSWRPIELANAIARWWASAVGLRLSTALRGRITGTQFGAVRLRTSFSSCRHCSSKLRLARMSPHSLQVIS